MRRHRAASYGYCPPWCLDRAYEGTGDHPALHLGQSFGVGATTASGARVTLFVEPAADYAHDVPARAVDGNLTRPRIQLALDDDEPVACLTAPAARSVAAALVRMADQLETGPHR